MSEHNNDDVFASMTKLNADVKRLHTRSIWLTAAVALLMALGMASAVANYGLARDLDLEVLAFATAISFVLFFVGTMLAGRVLAARVIAQQQSRSIAKLASELNVTVRELSQWLPPSKE